MIFIILTFIAAFLIEGLGTAVSVIGLSTLFGANPIIISLAVALDLGKLVVVSLLYKHWTKMGVVMKGYALIAAAVTMLITSAGAAGYLTGEFQKAIMGTQETSLKVDVLKQQQAKYEERKKQIDDQIANLPEKTTVNQRIKLMKQFQDEQKVLQAKIEDIDKQLPELQVKQIGVEAKAGPILYISKAFNVSVEEAVKYVVLMIIFVFDPLAVFLIIAGNFLVAQREQEKRNVPVVEQVNIEPVEVNEDPYYAQELAELEPKTQAQEPVVTEEPAAEALSGESVTAPVTETTSAESLESVSETYTADEEVEPVTPGDAETAYELPIEEELTTEEATGEAISQEEALPEPEVTELIVPKEEVVVEREEITLDDLRPHRSSLHDVRGDAMVVFDQDPRVSAHAADYK